MTKAMQELANRCAEADEAFQRILKLSDDRAVSPEAMAIAAAMVLTIHGRLFAECAAALTADGDD